MTAGFHRRHPFRPVHARNRHSLLSSHTQALYLSLPPTTYEESLPGVILANLYPRQAGLAPLMHTLSGQPSPLSRNSSGAQQYGRKSSMLSSLSVIFLANVDDCLDFEYSSDVLRLFIYSTSTSMRRKPLWRMDIVRRP